MSQRMSWEIEPMRRAHISACEAIINNSSFFQEWGLSGASMARALGESLDAGEDDLRVLLDEKKRARAFSWAMPYGAFGRSAYLRLLAVDESRRRSGAGRALMTALEEDYLEPSGIALLVSAMNLDARRFYESLGYAQVGLLPDYVKPGIDECLYFKSARRVQGA